MKIRITTVLFSLIVSTICYSQNITDTVFKNVIKITDNNVATNGSDYLFGISISKAKRTPVVYVQAKVPLNLLPGIYPEFSKIIVIAEFSNHKLPKDIVSAEPMLSYIIYRFERKNGKLLKDSLIVEGISPKMEFANKSKLETDNIDVYFYEGYGSVCCPMDEQWSNKPSRIEFIADFEKENKVKVSDTYVEQRGREGEAGYYYTLNGLSKELKLKFILERNFSRIMGKYLKDIITMPKIYTPTLLEFNYRLKKI